MRDNSTLMVATIAIAVVASLMTGCATNGPVYGRGTATMYDDRGRVSVAFTNRDRELIRHYFGKQLPPGLAKREQLPPGLRKQLVRRGTLPPGLQTHRLPSELDRQLSLLPHGYVRLRVASDVLLLDEQSRVILDVITDVGR